jgi:MFS family permease
MVNQEANQSAKTNPRFFYGYIIVAAAFFTQVTMHGTRSSFGIFFKPILSDFGWTRALISGAFSISSILQGLSGIIMGGLNDRLGPRIVMTICGFLVGLGLLLMSQVNTSWQLYLFYAVILGIGMGGLLAPPMSTVARWFVKRRSVMMGIVAAGGGTSTLVMPLLANWLISAYGWRNAYIILGFLVLVIVILVAQFLRRDPAKMGLLPYGENQVQEQRLNLVVEGLSLKEAILTRQFWMVVTTFFSFGYCAVTIQVHLVPHATDLGISATMAASIFATSGVVMIAGSLLLGSLADRIGGRQTFILCLALMLASLLWLLIAREVWMLYFFVIVMGFAFGGATTMESPLVAELFGIRSHGLILGVCNFCLTIGSTLGPFIAGYIFDVNDSYQLAFIILVIVMAIGVILAALLRPIKQLKLV